jgi:hypothetical protein
MVIAQTDQYSARGIYEGKYMSPLKVFGSAVIKMTHEVTSVPFFCNLFQSMSPPD